MSIRWLNAFFALALAVCSVQSHAAGDDAIRYSVKPNDTLYELALDYFVDLAAARKVQELNGISNPRRLQIGSDLVIPRSLLKHRPVRLVLQSFSGDVSLSKGTAVLQPRLGLELGEGTQISTGSNSFVSISGDGAARIAIPSNSRAIIVDARRYLISDEIDVELRVLQGRGEFVAPEVVGNGRYRVGTPVTVTAVRGTEFRVAFDEGQNVGLSEVIEGSVNVASGTDDVDTAAGFGISATSEGLGEVEALLPGPELLNHGTIKVDEQVSFGIDPVDGAAGYRTQISPDGGFEEVIAEVVGASIEPSFENIPDGRYFVGLRSISPSGLEGAARIYSFRRKQISVEAKVERSELADAFKFSWNRMAEPEITYAFQLWSADQPGVLIVDELALTQNTLLVSNLSSGKYRWRVASLIIDEGDAIKTWGPVLEFSVSE